MNIKESQSMAKEYSQAPDLVGRLYYLDWLGGIMAIYELAIRPLNPIRFLFGMKSRLMTATSR